MARLYDGAVERCAGALRGLNPSHQWPGGVNTALGSANHARNALHTAGVAASGFRFRNGRLVLEVNTESNPFRGDRSPADFRVGRGILGRLGVPDSYIERLAESQGTTPQRVSNGATRRMLREVAPTTPLGLLLARYPHLRNSRFTIEGNRVGLRVQLTRGPGTPPGAGGTRTGRVRLPGGLERIDRLSRGPAGKILTVADYGATAMGGGWIGGEVGSAAGGAINDLRHGDVGDVADAAAEAGKDVVSVLNSFD